MPATAIRILRSTGPALKFSGLVDAVRCACEEFASVEELVFDKERLDLELSWSEDRSVAALDSNGNETLLQYSVARLGHVSVRKKNLLLYVKSLGRKATILGSNKLKVASLKPISLNFGANLENLPGADRPLKDVCIFDLPVADIPALNVEIPTSNLSQIVELMRGTDARLIKVTIDVQNGNQLTLSKGSIRYRSSNEDQWTAIVDLVHQCIVPLISLDKNT